MPGEPQLVAWYERELKELGIPVLMGCEMTAGKIKNEVKPDVVIMATGSVPVMPRSIQGIDHPKCDSCVAVLRGHKPLGHKIVVVGGGLVGCEFAIDKAMGGADVTIREAAVAPPSGLRPPGGGHCPELEHWHERLLFAPSVP